MRDLGAKTPLDDDDVTEEEKEASAFYRSNSKTVEILKDGELQKAYFRVKDEDDLREEVKEQLKWNVDRSTTSNKIRDLMEWSEDIIDDIYYHRKVRNNPVSHFLVKHWTTWNNLVILLSLFINLIMVFSWKAKDSLTGNDIPPGLTELPDDIRNPKPDIRGGGDWYFTLILILGPIHNVLSLFVLLSYFIASRPQGPNFRKWIRSKYHSVMEAVDIDDEEEEEEEEVHDSKLRAQLFSFITFYYIAFFLLSIAGTISYGYFFAFHLLNIVYNNQLLQRVILAVTQNGESLLWVAVLHVIIIYIYALSAFALLRSNLSSEAGVPLYCSDLAQCSVTMLRYGLIGEIFDNMLPHESEASFHKFGMTAIFHITFFILITTIGLNIVFGIILDTFSELRDMKWTAESDMNSTCFICGRNNYEFETTGQGFEHHVKEEHNMWSYIFFFIHLESCRQNDYTDLENYVADQIENKRWDFFPIGQAMSLSSKDDDATETRIEELHQKLDELLKYQRAAQTERQRDQERERQQEWERTHKEVPPTGSQLRRDSAL